MTNKNERKIIIIGSRQSQLALKQTEIVKDQLQILFPNMIFEVLKVSTKGDQILDVSLNKLGKQIFTKELEMCLLEKKCDFVVHSLKDLSTSLHEELFLASILKREDPCDCIVLKDKCIKYNTMEDLPNGFILGTSSVRRKSILKLLYPKLKFKDIRGNLNTRLNKLDNFNDYDGLILAKSGLKRLNLLNRVSIELNASIFMYAVGQGALAIETRKNDIEMIEIVKKIEDYKTKMECLAERTLLNKLEGGCSVPIAVFTDWIDSKLYLKCLVCDLFGKEAVEASYNSEITKELDSIDLGTKVANISIEKGANIILNRIKINQI